MGELTPEPGTAPKMPQNTVVFNGAAVNLITCLIGEVRTDMRAMKEDLTKTFDDRFDAHEEIHDHLRAEDLEFQRRARERLAELEKADIAAAQAAGAAKARREGQLSIFHALTQIATMVEKYGKWIVVAVLGATAVISATLGGVKITFGS